MKAPSYERGGASNGGRTGPTTKGGVSASNKKKADARSKGAMAKAKSGARGKTRKALG